MTWRESVRYHLWKWVGVPMVPTRVADPALRAARTLEEVVRATEQGLSAATGRNVAVEREGRSLSARTLREFSDGMLMAARRHGRVPLDGLAVDSLPKSKFAQAYVKVEGDPATAQLKYYGGHIVLGEARFRPGGRFAVLQLARWTELAGHVRPRMLTPQAFGAHEVAHLVDSLMAHPEWKQADVMPDFPQSLRGQVVELIGERRGKPAGQVTLDDVAAELGANAASDFNGPMSELVADADADVTVNKGKSHPINRKVAERLAQAKESFVPGPGARLQVWRGREHTRSVTGLEHLLPDVAVPAASTREPARQPAPEAGPVREPARIHPHAPRRAVRPVADGGRSALVDPPVRGAIAARSGLPPTSKPTATPRRQSATAVNTRTLDTAPVISPYKTASELRLSQDRSRGL